MSDKETVIAFLQTFKDNLLIPLAVEGMLCKEVIEEAAHAYLKELEIEKATSEIIFIDKDGYWKDLHPLASMKFVVDEVTYPSITHFRHAWKYRTVEDEAFDYIMKASTPEIAAKRGQLALDSGTRAIADWEIGQEKQLKIAYRALLNEHPDLKKRLNDTPASVPIKFTNTNDKYLGEGSDKTGENILPKILKELRNE